MIDEAVTEVLSTPKLIGAKETGEHSAYPDPEQIRTAPGVGFAPVNEATAIASICKALRSMTTTEEFVTLKEAAERLNLYYHQLQRAAKKGMFPAYTPFGRRIYVRLSEVTDAIEAARVKAEII